MGHWLGSELKVVDLDLPYEMKTAAYVRLTEYSA